MGLAGNEPPVPPKGFANVTVMERMSLVSLEGTGVFQTESIEELHLECL